MSGVHLVAASELAAADPGVRVAQLVGVRDLTSFHTRIAAVLGFPSYYGRNLDALWDCLAELDGPTELRWTGWAGFAVHHPRDWARVLGVLTERAADPGFTLVCVADAPQPVLPLDHDG